MFDHLKHFGLGAAGGVIWLALWLRIGLYPTALFVLGIITLCYVLGYFIHLYRR